MVAFAHIAAAPQQIRQTKLKLQLISHAVKFLSDMPPLRPYAIGRLARHCIKHFCSVMFRLYLPPQMSGCSAKAVLAAVLAIRLGNSLTGNSFALWWDIMQREDWAASNCFTCFRTARANAQCLQHSAREQPPLNWLVRRPWCVSCAELLSKLWRRLMLRFDSLACAIRVSLKSRACLECKILLPIVVHSFWLYRAIQLLC